jgi:hypothetical protein
MSTICPYKLKEFNLFFLQTGKKCKVACRDAIKGVASEVEGVKRQMHKDIMVSASWHSTHSHLILYLLISLTRFDQADFNPSKVKQAVKLLL